MGKKWLDLTLTELVTQSLENGLVPIVTFPDKSKIEVDLYELINNYFKVKPIEHGVDTKDLANHILASFYVMIARSPTVQECDATEEAQSDKDDNQ